MVGLEAVSGTASMEIDGLTWEEVLTRVLACRGYRWQLEGEAIRVLPPPSPPPPSTG